MAAAEAPPYQDSYWLYHQYVEQGRSYTDIGDECDVSATCIGDWVHEFELKDEIEPPIYEDKEWLEQKYAKEGMTQQEVADEAGCSQHKISVQLREFGIQTRNGSAHGPASYYFDVQGREFWRVKGDSIVYVPRLLAVNKYGFEAVKNMDVHHKNGKSIDNREENLELMTDSEHMSLHAKKRGIGGAHK